MPQDMCPTAVKAAFYQECQSAAFREMQAVEENNDTVLAKVPLGADMYLYDNADTVISGVAKQPVGKFRTMDYQSTANKPLVAGEMSARGCNNAAETFNVNMIDNPNKGCETARCKISTAQGYEIRGSLNRKYEYETPVICVEYLESLSPSTAREYLDQLVSTFQDHGERSYVREIRNMAIANSGANGSVISANDLLLTSGGFCAPPTSRITIHYLKEYAAHLKRIGAIPNNGKLVVSGLEQDYLDALTEHMARRYVNSGLPFAASNIKIEACLFDDTETRMKGNKYYEIDDIRWIVTNDPRYVYFKPAGVTPSGQTLYDIIDIERDIIVEGDAGVFSKPNPDYGKEYIWCDGVKYPTASLLEVLNEKQFSRHNLKEPIDISGRRSLTQNFKMHIVDGAFIDCNDMNKKFKLVAERRYRWRNRWVEYGGFIAYLSSRPCGYTLPRCEKPCDPVTPAPATVQLEGDCGAQPCGDCSTQTPVTGLVSMSPCGTVETLYDGTTRRVRLAVSRTLDSNGAASVTYSLTDGTAINGTHYVDVTNPLGTISWLDGEKGTKYIEIDIINGIAGTDADFSVELGAVSGNIELDECVKTTVLIEMCAPEPLAKKACADPVLVEAKTIEGAPEV